MGDVALTAATRSALLSVHDAVKMREKAQRSLESGKVVNDAIDDAVKYYQSTALSDRAESFADVKSGMDQAVSLLQATDVGLSSVQSIYKQMKGLLQTAKTADSSGLIDLAKQWDELLQQTGTIAADTTYQGVGLIHPPDVAIEGETEPLAVQVSPDNPAATVEIKSAILAPPSRPWVTPGANVLLFDSRANVTIDQSKIDTTTDPTQIFEATRGGQALAVYNAVKDPLSYRPTLYYNPGTGQILNEDTKAAGGAYTFLSNVQLLGTGSQDPAYANAATGWDNPAWVLQATFTGDPSVPDGTYKIAIQEVGAHGMAGGPFYPPYNTQQSPVIPPNSIHQQGQTVDWSYAFNGFRTPGGITLAEAACDKSTAYIQSLRSYYGGKMTFLQNKMNFSEQMVNTLSEGSDKLTLADLNEQGAALVALRTREQIGVQSIGLSANAQANILTVIRP